MNLYSPNPWWLIRNGYSYTYPGLATSTKSDVAVLGAGITGALAAHYLTAAGFSVIVADRRHVGMGSTSASTSLIQYEIDVSLHELIKRVGFQNAVRSYMLCREAIGVLNRLGKDITGPGEIDMRPSLQFATYLRDVPSLHAEVTVRKANGFDVDWLTRSDLQRSYGLDFPAAILSADGATLNAFQLTHALLQRAMHHGASVVDNTHITGIQHHPRHIILTCANGAEISARHLVIACGYESQRFMDRKVDELNSTYAIISKPLRQQTRWYRDSVIWETAKPYRYLRTTRDNRIIIGGKDDKFYNPVRRDAALARKALQLKSDFDKMLPCIPFETDFSWAGTFSSTRDGLPFIGQIRTRPRTWFALGYGGNGIVFSVVAARLIARAIAGKRDNDLDIFSFDR